MSTDQELLDTLIETEGFSSVEEFLSTYMTDSVCPGICRTPRCGYTIEVEPDSRDGWCEECQKGTVISGIELALRLPSMGVT